MRRIADAGRDTVFVDAADSVGAFEAPAGLRAAVGGRLLYVAECRARCDLFRRVHHWEFQVRKLLIQPSFLVTNMLMEGDFGSSFLNFFVGVPSAADDGQPIMLLEGRF